MRGGVNNNHPNFQRTNTIKSLILVNSLKVEDKKFTVS